MTELEPVVDVTPERFHRSIRAAAQPVLMRGLASDWPAVAAARGGERAFVEYLSRFASDEAVPVAHAPPEIEGRFHYRDDAGSLNFAKRAASLRHLFAALIEETHRPHPSSLAAQGLEIDRCMPGFADENWLQLLDPAIRPRAWIGNAAKVATHHDPLENIACVVAGRRRFTLFPPEQLTNLYMGPFDPTPAGTPVSMVHVTKPDLTRYPRFAQAMAAAFVANLEPGDAIYIPYQWYHHVEAIGGVTMLVNYWWNAAADVGGSPWDAMLHGMMALRGLPEDQRRAWREMFDHYVFLTDGDPGAHLPAAARGVLAATSARDLEEMRRTLIRHLKQGMPQ